MGRPTVFLLPDSLGANNYWEELGLKPDPCGLQDTAQTARPWFPRFLAIILSNGLTMLAKAKRFHIGSGSSYSEGNQYQHKDS